jgi:hypothetical protein
MREYPTQHVAITLERETVESRWESHRWNLLGAVPDVGGDARTIHEDERRLHRLYPGFSVSLYPEEAEGYYLNVSSEAPSIFVALRQDEASGDVHPFQVTLNYTEAARWMDGGERVERTRAWPELIAWMGQWVEDNYRPEPKKRVRPNSFKGKEGALRKEGSSS